MRCLIFALVACVARSQDLEELRWMAQTAAWGAANDQKYGRSFGEWDAHNARLASHLDAVNEALEESPVVKHLNEMSSKAAWGATNERAYGKERSGSQVDWDMHRSEALKLREWVGADFAIELEAAAKTAAWYGANRYQYGESHADTQNDLQKFRHYMQNAKALAPEKWPVEDVEQIFKYNALAAASHRATELAERKGANFLHDTLVAEADRDDWKSFHTHAIAFKKELGPDRHSLFQHFEGMVLEASYGAVAERSSGRHSSDAKTHWKREDFHAREAEALYKENEKFNEIREMIRMAAWGAANERAFGARASETVKSWASFKRYVAMLLPTHGEL
jgi:hypothetical protein